MRQLVALNQEIDAKREELVATLARKFPKGCIVRVRYTPNPIEYVVVGHLPANSTGYGSLLGLNPQTGRRRTFHFSKIMARRFPKTLPVPVDRLEDSQCSA